MHPSSADTKFDRALWGYLLRRPETAKSVEQSDDGPDKELFNCTWDSLRRGHPFASNYEVLSGLHVSFREWATNLPLGARWTTHHIARSYRWAECFGYMEHCGQVRHGRIAHLLPIGMHFSNDPGRAFELAVAASNFVEADSDICLATGTLAMLVAMISDGASIPAAARETAEFLMCVDFGEDLAGALRHAVMAAREEGLFSSHAPRGQDAVMHSVRFALRATSSTEAIEESFAAARPLDEIRVVGILTCLALGNCQAT